jgi:hypothetical protein
MYSPTDDILAVTMQRMNDTQVLLDETDLLYLIEIFKGNVEVDVSGKMLRSGNF